MRAAGPDLTTGRATRPVSERRNATEKRARTRRRVIREARACIAEKGVSEATAAEIARRCDLSWGVIQYHFGDRFGLFLALLEEGVELLSRALEGVGASQGMPLEKRVRQLVNDVWKLMSNQHSLVLLEVELQLGRDRDHQSRVRRYVRDTRRQMAAAWRKALPECSEAEVAAAAGLAMSALRGLALEKALEGRRTLRQTECDTIVLAVLGCLNDQKA